MDNCLNTVSEMLEDRGYKTMFFQHSTADVPSDAPHLTIPADLNIGPIQERPPVPVLRELIKANKPIMVGYNQDKSNVLVFFSLSVKVGVSMARVIIQRMETMEVKHAILVYAYTPSHKSREELRTANVELFHCSTLFRNLIKYHKLIPRHEKVGEDEITNLLQRLGCSKDQLPGYSKQDPVVRYYGWEVGTVVRIYRTLGGQYEPEIYYRVIRNMD